MTTKAWPTEMTEEDFLQALTRTTEVFSWKVNKSGQLRAKQKQWWPLRGEYCPITCVVRLLLGGQFSPNEYLSAALRIKLSKTLRQKIVAAADSELHEPTLRGKFIDALGLA